MKNKFLFVAALAMIALLVSACGPTTVNQAAPIPQRTVSVTGLGYANLVPDIAYIYVGVHTEKPSAAEAVDENNAQTQAMTSFWMPFGVSSDSGSTQPNWLLSAAVIFFAASANSVRLVGIAKSPAASARSRLTNTG